MIEHPELLEPSVKANEWEKTTVQFRVEGADRELVVMSFPAFAHHVQEVQNVPYQFWEIVRGVIGAGVEGFVYHPPHVRTPARTKSTHRKGGKSPKTSVCLREQLLGEGTEGTEEAKAVETVPPELPHSSEEEEEKKEGEESLHPCRL